MTNDAFSVLGGLLAGFDRPVEVPRHERWAIERGNSAFPFEWIIRKGDRFGRVIDAETRLALAARLIRDDWLEGFWRGRLEPGNLPLERLVDLLNEFGEVHLPFPDVDELHEEGSPVDPGSLITELAATRLALTVAYEINAGNAKVAARLVKQWRPEWVANVRTRALAEPDEFIARSLLLGELNRLRMPAVVRSREGQFPYRLVPQPQTALQVVTLGAAIGAGAVEKPWDTLGMYACADCGSIFERSTAPVAGDRVFCSTKCGTRFHARLTQAKARAAKRLFNGRRLADLSESEKVVVLGDPSVAKHVGGHTNAR